MARHRYSTGELTCGNTYNPATYRDGLPEDAWGTRYDARTGKGLTGWDSTFSVKKAMQWVMAGYEVRRVNDWSGKVTMVWNARQ